MKKLLIAFVVTTLFTATATLNAQVILNEYNAVSGSNHLDEELFADSDQADTAFGRIQGNGGNWFELLVIGDAESSIVDMRGWTLNWTEEEEVSPGVNAQGTITLSNDSIWAAVERGTMLTFIETPDAGGISGINTSTDVSFDPSADDWHMNFCTTQEQVSGTLLTAATNDGLAGEFSVGNDNWQLTIMDADGNVVSGPTGEGDGNLSGVSSREVGKLEGLIAPDATLDGWLALELATAPTTTERPVALVEPTCLAAAHKCKTCPLYELRHCWETSTRTVKSTFRISVRSLASFQATCFLLKLISIRTKWWISRTLVLSLDC